MARLILFAAGLALTATAQARPVHYQQRPDLVPPALADSEGQAVVTNCTACHSLDYIATQPRGKGAQFWRDEVTKMVNVYKAPVTPSDADAVAGVLGRKFGGTG